MRHEWKDPVDHRTYAVHEANVDHDHLWLTALTGAGPFTVQPGYREILRLATENARLRSENEDLRTALGREL